MNIDNSFGILSFLIVTISAVVVTLAAAVIKIAVDELGKIGKDKGEKK